MIDGSSPTPRNPTPLSSRIEPEDIVAHAAEGDARDRPETTEQEAADRSRQLRRSLISLFILGVLVVALLVAVPGLDGVEKLMRHADGWWLAAAVVLEIGSCLGYVLVVQLVFARAPLRFAARLALAELAFGAAVSLGGAGSIALGAWVLHAVGVPTRRIVERSAVLFLLTSAANAIVLIVFGVGLWLGLPGPENALLGILPAAAGLLIFLVVLAIPRWVDMRQGPGGGAGKLTTTLTGMAAGIRATKTMLVTPNWRLIGAYAYLLCDIAALWACFKALGFDLPIAALVLAYQIGYLANIIPIPGGIGVLDTGLVAMLVLYGAPAITAAAAVLLYHAIVLWVPSLWGTVAYALLRRQMRHPILPRTE